MHTPAVEDLLSGRRVSEKTDDEDEGVPEQDQIIACTPSDKLRLFLMLYLSCNLDEGLMDYFLEKYVRYAIVCMYVCMYICMCVSDRVI